MQNKSPAYMGACINAVEQGLVPRKLVVFRVKRRDNGAPVVRAFWDETDTIDIPVLDGFDGTQKTYSFIGDGSLLGVSDIVYVSDLSVQPVTVTLSQIAPFAQQLVREFEARLGRLEIWEYLLDPLTRLPVSVEWPDFIGQISKAPIKNPTSGGEGSIQITAHSDAIAMLTRKNPRKASYEGHKAARGDEWGLYRAAMETVVEMPWGTK
ncbi:MULTISPECIES: hypothetical protein [unclassified Ensifer]|uniref:hypothetical protein n=1 Tax=unclassified Ensifer TaxID=2633371 RepID=UPI00081333B8|nr:MULTISPECIES: hypothetical protein [unclassified Ensifer]OCP17371.1 hypothetical protein BC361_07880 [Ensifer sp. LC54]OCP28724.1 hypothetical protein BC363_02480 [Ensifer sp. LC384]